MNTVDLIVLAITSTCTLLLVGVGVIDLFKRENKTN